MISTDQHSVYHFGYPQFLSEPDVMTEVNYSVVYIKYSHTPHLDINGPDLR